MRDNEAVLLLMVILLLTVIGCRKADQLASRQDFYRGLVAMEVEVKDAAPAPEAYRCHGTKKSGDGLGPCPGCVDCKPGSNPTPKPAPAPVPVPVNRVTEGVLFGAEWCSPCKAVLNELIAAGYDVGEGPGHQIRYVNVDALKPDEVKYPARYNYPDKVPYFVAVDPQGNARVKLTGRHPLSDYQSALRKVQR